MSGARISMSSVDRSWLRMESPQNPMMISAVLAFDKEIDIQRLKEVLRTRLLRFGRFRQRVEFRGERVYWRDDPLFDLDNHLHLIALPGKRDQKSLENVVSDLNSTPLNFNRPLWQVHYVDEYDGGCALIVRIHHCIADGISLVRVLLSLTDEEPGARVVSMPSRPNRTVPRISAWKRMKMRLDSAARAGREQVQLLRRSMQEEPNYPTRLLSTASDVALDCLKLVFAHEEPRTSLSRPLCGRKQVAWATPIPLADVKVCARALDGTVNDVLMSVATGAIHKHFSVSGETIPACGIRVAVPFNLRPIDQPIESLGNQFGLVLIGLPVDVECPVMRFHQVREQMLRIKRSYQAQVSYSLLDFFGRGPDILERRALDLLSRKASAVLTNVPGPKHDVYLAGAKLKQPMFWVPQTGDVGIGMSIFTYAGSVQFGITADRNLGVNPIRVMDHFHNSFIELQNKVLHRDAPVKSQPLAV